MRPVKLRLGKASRILAVSPHGCGFQPPARLDLLRETGDDRPMTTRDAHAGINLICIICR
jgi:hypothetical protein